MSLRGSNWLLVRIGEMTIDVPPISSVVPSGFARAAASVPIMVAPPARFSTKKLRPVSCESSFATSRPVMSVEPPAA